VTTRVSVSSSGAQAVAGPDPFGGTSAAGISADGRYVVMVSDAPNLVPGDTNGFSDIFVRDRATRRTTRMSVGARGRQANGSSGFPAISADGRYVAFQSIASDLVAGDRNGRWDVFVRDRFAHTTRRVSVPTSGPESNGDSEAPALSDHGRYVTYTSNSTNLVPGDTNRLADVFVRDTWTGRTERVSVDSRGRQATGSPTNNGSNAPSITAHGRYVVFHSDQTNLVPGDTNGVFDIFVHDRWTGRTSRVSIGDRGEQANAETLGSAAVSAHGRYVAFTSLATNLVPGDDNAADISDLFVRDRYTGRTILAGVTRTGAQGDDSSWPGVTSGGGRAFSSGARLIVFNSWAANMVLGDTNGWPDVFVRSLASR
jgi:Tol biopolymer transport system component